jgi:hypothetical protein
VFRNFAGEYLPELAELTAVLIPIIVVWIFRKRAGEDHDYHNTAPMRIYRSMLGSVIRHRYASQSRAC